MKRYKLTAIVLTILTLGLLGGCSSGAATYSEHTDVEVFQNVPIMEVEGAITSTADDYGDGNYVIQVNKTTKSDYDAYLALLEKEGFTKYVDNGEGFDGTVFTATYTKDDLVVNVLQLDKNGKTYICAGNETLSEHLLYNDNYVADNVEGAQTKIHMVEMYYFGSSFIIQLKNGHFIVNDGGTDYDAPYLFDYLEELAPEGEKPVVEAWVISHAHYDHIGWVRTFQNNYADYEGRVLVEGFYYNEPNAEVVAEEGKIKDIAILKDVIKHIKTTDGKTPEIYRLHTGQRFYFNDIIMDVSLSQEQLLFEDYEDGFNESSTWLLYTIEGETVMIGGDSGPAGMKAMMEIYSKEYCTFDFYSALHHGYNIRADFTEYCTIDVVMYTERKVVSSGSKGKMNEKARETYSYGDGTMIFTFPYTEGSAECIGNNQWLYHAGQVRPQL